MSAFYDRYVKLCALKGVSLSRAAENIGLSRTSPNGWKKGKMPSDVTLAKLADYFGCTVGDLTGEAKKPIGIAADELSESEIKVLELFRLLPRDRQIVITSIIEDTLRMYGIIK